MTGAAAKLDKAVKGVGSPVSSPSHCTSIIKYLNPDYQ